MSDFQVDCPDCGSPYDENCADCDVPAGWISLAARLAEVEAANAKFIEKLNTHLTAEDRRSLAALLGYELGVEEGRAEGQAERDRLAQELEDAVEASFL